MLEQIDAVIALTKQEPQELRDWERVIAHRLDTFIQVGTALVAIRDQRLYRAPYNTFEDLS